MELMYEHDMVEDYNGNYTSLLFRFCKYNIPNCYYIFRITKLSDVGIFSDLVIVPKYAVVRDLKQILNLQIGQDTFEETFFSDRTTGYHIFMTDVDITKPLHTILSDITTSFTPEECNLCVYQLYYNSPEPVV